jgi:type IV pilus assembly protein PilB
MTERKRLGEMLIEAGMIDNMQLQSALGHQKQWGGKLGDILLEMDFISEHVLADFFESHLNIPCLDLSDFEIPANVRGLLKDEIIKKYSVVPIGYENKVLTVAMSDPSDIKTIDELQFATGYRIKPVLVFSLDVKRLIQRYFGEEVSPGHQYKSKVHEIAEKKDFELVRDEKQEIQKKEVTVKDYLDAMTSLLIEKGVITREELQKKIRELIK